MGIQDKKLTGLDEDSLARFRNEHIWFIFQFHYLLADLSAVENVALLLMIARIPARESAGLAKPRPPAKPTFPAAEPRPRRRG